MSPFSRLQPETAAPEAAGGRRPLYASNVRSGGDGAGTGAEPAPLTSGHGWSPSWSRPAGEIRTCVRVGAAGGRGAQTTPPHTRLLKKLPLGQEHVLGLPRISGDFTYSPPRRICTKSMSSGHRFRHCPLKSRSPNLINPQVAHQSTGPGPQCWVLCPPPVPRPRSSACGKWEPWWSSQWETSPLTTYTGLRGTESQPASQKLCLPL